MLVLFRIRLLLKWRWKVPRPVIWVDHRRLVYVIRSQLVLPECLHVIAKLTCHRRRPAIMCTIVVVPLNMDIIRVLIIFCRCGLGLLLMSSLDDTWCKLSPWGGRRLGSASGVLGTIWCLGRFRLLETVVLTSVVLRSISAFVRVHSGSKCACCVSWYSME